MRCISTPTVFLRNLTAEGRTPSGARKDVFAEALYILAAVGVLLLLALIPTNLPQASWDVCIDAYGPVSETAPLAQSKSGRSSVAHIPKDWVTKSFNSFSSLLLLLSTIWHSGLSQDRILAFMRAPQLRMFLLLAAAVYATLFLGYSGEGLFAALLSCVTHMIDVVMLVFGDPQLRIETWG